MIAKTPEQIAELHAHSVDAYQDSAEEVGHPDGQPIIETFPQLAGIIVAAIEADRAQREEVAVTLPSGQDITAWIGTSHADGSALVQIDTGGTPGNVRVFINDAEDPLLDENPETGEYQDMLEGAGE